MKAIEKKLKRKARRANRVRRKLLIGKTRARLTVFRSNKYLYAQVIDDNKRVTLASVSEKEIEKSSMNKTQKAEALGAKMAEKALAKKVKEVVFDKGSYRYHGRVKAFAEAARVGGLVF